MRMGCTTPELAVSPRYHRHATETTNLQPTSPMLRWTLLFLVIAIIAGLFGFTGIAGTASDIARVLFFVFLVLLIISAIVSAFRGKPPV
jgi:uncharacterized membrane protein YtjA (UPF0391 family)